MMKLSRFRIKTRCALRYSIEIFLVAVGFSVMGMACGGHSVESPALSVPECLAAPDCSKILVCAHRGSRHLGAVENSLGSIEDAIAIGVDVIEIDLRQARDGTIVLMHDETLKRTSEGRGLVSDYDGPALQAFKLKNSEESIPTLSEALAISRGQAMLLLDIKSVNLDVLVAEVLAQDALDWVLFSDAGRLDALASIEAPIRSVFRISTVAELGQIPMARQPSMIEVRNNYGLELPPQEVFQAAAETSAKVFENVLGVGDVLAALGDYQQWDASLARGSRVLQTDLPEELIPFLEERGLR